MREFEFDSNRLLNAGGLFSQEVDGDPWVVFHGTTGANEAGIDSTGLARGTPSISKVDVESVTMLFDSIRWAGRSFAGFFVLKAYSLDHDYANADVKPLFLAETSYRAALYAMLDFAGGESTRAIRYAFDDLEAFLADPVIRAENSKRLKREHEGLEGTDRYRELVREPDLGWLADRLANLAPLRERCVDALSRHEYGVVYAIQMQPSDLRHLEYHNMMGLKAWCDIPASRLVAKIRLPPDSRYPSLIQDKRRRCRITEPGVISAAMSAGRGSPK